jgi:hypothetical protein
MIFLTGGTHTERARRFVEMHRDRVQLKPFRARELTELLTELLSRSPIEPHVRSR